MKSLLSVPLAMLLALILTGCDFAVPLTETPKENLDPALIGRWANLKADAELDLLLVLPLDEREMLVSFPHGRGKENMIARCCLTKVGQLRLVQIRWLGSGDGEVPDTKDFYQYMSYEISGTTLTVRQLDPDKVDRNHETGETLAAAILALEKDPNLFREAMVFHRVPTQH